MNTRNIVRQSGIALLCAFASALTMVGFVAAFEVDQPVQRVVVKFGDLNLTRSDDIAVLYQRIRTAASRVCVPASPRELAWMTRSDGCVADATARAIVSINATALTNYYRSRNLHERT